MFLQFLTPLCNCNFFSTMCCVSELFLTGFPPVQCKNTTWHCANLHALFSAQTTTLHTLYLVQMINDATSQNFGRIKEKELMHENAFVGTIIRAYIRRTNSFYKFQIKHFLNKNQRNVKKLLATTVRNLQVQQGFLYYRNIALFLASKLCIQAILLKPPYMSYALSLTCNRHFPL